MNKFVLSVNKLDKVCLLYGKVVVKGWFQNYQPMKTIALAATAFVLITSACNKKVIYNTNLRASLDSKTITPEKLQFYIDRDLEMRREVASNNTKITDGKIQQTKGKQIELLNLKELTPGICVSFNDSSLRVAFDQQNYLTFVAQSIDPNYTNYMLQTSINKNGQHEVDYGNQTYIIPETATHAVLLVKRKDANKIKVKSKTIKGRKIN